MACLLYTLMIVFFTCSLCGGIPIKPIPPCYGTECYYYDTDYTDNNVKVTFPENFTDAILLALPNIQGSQGEMITFMNKTLISQDKTFDLLERRLEIIEGSQDEMITFMNKKLISQDKVSDLLERRLELIEGSQNELVTFMNKMLISQDKTFISQDKVAALLQNLEESVENMDTGIQSIGQQIKNMTATMTDLMGSMVNILQNQLDILNKEDHSKLEQKITVKPTELPTTDITTVKPSTEIQRSQIMMQTSELQPVKDCQDIAARGIIRSRPYVITPPDGLGSFEVYCDLESDNRGWTVIQKRFDGSVDFYRNWTQYEQGFGNKSGEYWLGLKNIRRLILDGTWALKIDLESFEGETAYAVYDSFEISDAASNYRLSVGEYSGNAGDSLKYSGIGMHNGMAFSTHDRDNDGSSGSRCASIYKAGWWYNRCLWAHLNGRYLGSDGNTWRGMMWYTWKVKQSLKSSQMKIRRVP